MVRGQTKLYSRGNMSRSITSLLGEKRIFDLVPGNTYGSKREVICFMLVKGQLTYDLVKGLPDLWRTTEEDLYGSQRRRAQLPLKWTTGEVMERPRITHDESYDGPFVPNEPPPIFRGYGGFNQHKPMRNSAGQWTKET